MHDVRTEGLILGYLEHTNDLEYLVEVAEGVECSSLEELIAGMLRSGDHVTVFRTSLFVMDAILLRPWHQTYNRFRDSYSPSAVVSALESLLAAPDYRMRQSAVATLGRTCSKLSLPAMHHAFHALLEKDALLLQRLAFEIFWLEEKDSLNLIDDALASEQYLTRWAALAITGHRSGQWDKASPERQFCARVFSQLVADPSARVSAEAEYRLALLELLHNSDGMPRPARKAARREIEKRRPSLCFADLEIRFGNYLYQSGSQDYDVSDLDQFVRSQPE